MPHSLVLVSLHLIISRHNHGSSRKAETSLQAGAQTSCVGYTMNKWSETVVSALSLSNRRRSTLSRFTSPKSASIFEPRIAPVGGANEVVWEAGFESRNGVQPQYLLLCQCELQRSQIVF